MSESRLERKLAFRLAVAYDCWGNRRPVRTARHNGLWALGPVDFDQPFCPEVRADTRIERALLLHQLIESGTLTATEARTLNDLIVDGLTVNEIAERDECSRQAVLARLLGNSRGQGGIAKKVRAWLLHRAHRSDVKTSDARLQRTQSFRAGGGGESLT